MTDGQSQAEQYAKIRELVTNISVAMLGTFDDTGTLHARPMATQDRPFAGTLTFLTSRSSRKVEEILRNPNVHLSYVSGSSHSYLSIRGEGDISDNRPRIKELWNPLMKAWFDGPDDPDIVLIDVRVNTAEYWDTPGGKLASMISLVRGAVTGSRSDQGKHDTVKFAQAGI